MPVPGTYDDMYKDFQVFRDRLSYTFNYNHQKIELSVQLYENDSNYYRMFAYTKCNGVVGMAFSINLTRNRMSDGIYKLGNQLKFSERIPVDEEMANFIRKRKQEVYADFLESIGLNVTEKNEVIFGEFDPNAASKKTAFIGTSAKQLLYDCLIWQSYSHLKSPSIMVNTVFLSINIVFLVQRHANASSFTVYFKRRK